MSPGPYAWNPHLVAWGVIAVGTAATVVGHRRLSRSAATPDPWTGKEIAAFCGAVGAAVVALTWPLADLAARWSLVALVVQRLLLVLAVPALALAGLPSDVLRWLTRPAPVDAVIDAVRRPAVAVVVVTVSVVGSMTVPVVEAQASSAVVRGVVDLWVLVAGVVLWLPVLGRVPGPLRLQPWGRFGYLVVQAVVPAFLSIIYIFARHPLYPTFARSHLAIGVRPLNDQQLSGFVSKLTMLVVLLSVGAVYLVRAQRLDQEDADGEPLLWSDVERELERADRRDARRRRAGSALPSGAEGPEEPGTDDRGPG